MLPERDPKDDVTDRVTDPDVVCDALLLTDVDPYTCTPALVSFWTDDERAVAYEWALREHLGASDNYYIVRFKKPPHVEALGTYQWKPNP